MLNRMYTKTYTAEGIQLVYMSEYDPFKQNEDMIPNTSFHAHEYYELFWCDSTEFHVQLNDHILTIGKGEFLLMPPGVLHHCIEFPVPDRLVICFTVKASDPDCTAPFLPLLARNVYTRWKQDEGCRVLVSLFKTAQQAEHLTEMSIYLFALLTHAAALLEPLQENLHSFLQDDSINRLYKIDMLFGTYYKNNVPLEMVASELNISIRQLSRIIKKQYGCTYGEKILSMRMKEAIKLLHAGKSIAETSEEMGYGSVRSFSAAFKKYYGYSPRHVKF